MTPLYKEYEEHHFQNVEDIGIAWDGRRVWVCLNGQSLFRAKIINGALFTEYHPGNVKDLGMMKERL